MALGLASRHTISQKVSFNAPRAAKIKRGHLLLSNSASQPSGVFQRASDAADAARHKARELFEQHRVQERASAAGKTATRKVKETYEQVEDTVRRTALTVDEKYDISGKTQKALRRAREQAEGVDTKYGIRRKLRNAGEDFARKWPKWRKQYALFSKTTLGTLFNCAVFFWLFQSGIIWRVLNFLFIMWWLLPLFLVPWLQSQNKKAAEEFARVQQARAAARARQNPFSGFGTAFGRGPAAAQRGQSRGSSRPVEDDYGPVIDAEYYTVDDGDS